MSEPQNTNRKFLERWANMYALARTIPDDDRFDMETWGNPKTETACGTVACMAGHAGLHPWFRRRGLVPDINLEVEHGEVYGDIDFDNEALADFWGTGDFYHIPGPFNPMDSGYLEYDRITPKRAAKRVKDWMLQWWPKDEVEAAIANATVEYDAAWVHKYTPWNRHMRNAS